MSKCSGMKQVNALAMISFMLRRRGALIKAPIAQTQQEEKKKSPLLNLNLALNQVMVSFLKTHTLNTFLTYCSFNYRGNDIFFYLLI